MDTTPKLTCLEFSVVKKANPALLKLFRTSYTTHSNKSENKELKTFEEWDKLFVEFQNRK